MFPRLVRKFYHDLFAPGEKFDVGDDCRLDKAAITKRADLQPTFTFVSRGVANVVVLGTAISSSTSAGTIDSRRAASGISWIICWFGRAPLAIVTTVVLPWLLVLWPLVGSSDFASK